MSHFIPAPLTVGHPLSNYETWLERSQIFSLGSPGGIVGGNNLTRLKTHKGSADFGERVGEQEKEGEDQEKGG